MFEMTLPDPGEGLLEAEITQWLVAPGDEVAVNDVVVEIETAKSLVPPPELKHAKEKTRFGAIYFGSTAPAMDEALAALWLEVLGLAPTCREENFVTLGGNSISLVQMFTRLRARFGVEVSLRQLFETPTFAFMRELVLAARRQRDAQASGLLCFAGLPARRIRRDGPESEPPAVGIRPRRLPPAARRAPPRSPPGSPARP